MNEQLPHTPNECAFEFGSLRLICNNDDGTWSATARDFSIVRACAKFKSSVLSVSSTDFTVHETAQTDDSVIFAHRGHPSLDASFIQIFKQNGSFLTCDIRLIGDFFDTCSVFPLCAEIVFSHGVSFLYTLRDNAAMPKFLTSDQIGETTVGYGSAVFSDEETGDTLVVGLKHSDIFDGAFRFDFNNDTPHGFCAEYIKKSAHDLREDFPCLALGVFSDFCDGISSFASLFGRDSLDNNEEKVVPTFKILQLDDDSDGTSTLALAEKLREAWTDVSVCTKDDIDNISEHTVHDILKRHTVCFWKSRIHSPLVLSDDMTETEARYRTTAAVVAGNGILLKGKISDSQDSTNETFVKLLCNTDVAYVAQFGGEFIPHGRFSTRQYAEVYRLSADGALYLAVFNSEDTARTMCHELDGYLPDGVVYSAVELWSGTEHPMDGGTLTHELGAGDAALFRITPMAGNEQTLAEEPASPNGKPDLLSLLVCGAASLGILAAAAVLYGKRKNEPPKKE